MRSALGICLGVCLFMALAATAKDAVMTTATNSSMMTGVRRIVFVGDSLTDGSAWPDWVVETLKANGYPKLELFNAGISGDTIAGVKQRYAHDVLEFKPELVLINIGTNDINRQVPLADYRRDLDAVVAGIRQTGARVVLMTPPAMRDPARNTSLHPLNDIVREVAQAHDCTFVDMHTAFETAAAAGKALWGPDGIHHQIDGWRLLGRCTLDALGCTAPLLEQTTLCPGALVDWRISPPIPWKDGTPYPPLPEIPADPLQHGWQSFDRKAEVAATSWWQACWLERGGVMPLGQHVNPDSPGAPDRAHGAFALAVIHAKKERQAVLHLGGSPPYAVWLNGTLVWDGKTLHGYHPDAERITVTLHKGENRLLLFTNWVFYVSLEAK